MLVSILAFWSINAISQDLTSCGDGYVVDLSIGYTPTSFGLTLCGCSNDTSPCELVHIVMQRTEGSEVSLLECPEISLTERWWREKRDLVDIFDPVTCEEYPESASHMDRYIFDTSDLGPGDTLSILVCKTSTEDNNIIELSATPGPECSTFTCPPQMSCPVEISLHPDGQCRYVIPDFTSTIILRDTCFSPPAIVTTDYTLMQDPPPGSVVADPLFVEIEVATEEGEVISTCDVSVLLASNGPPLIESPSIIEDITVGNPLPAIEEIFGSDTVGLGIIQQIPAFGTVDTYLRDDCEGYSVTYRWVASDGCGAESTASMTFNVLPDTTGPVFTSLPQEIDTVRAGEPIPEQEELTAINPDGTADGVDVSSSMDAFLVDNCHGFEMTYRWLAVDSCDDATLITRSFFVEPNGTAPMFTSPPQALPNIYESDTLPSPEELLAVSALGSSGAITVSHNIRTGDDNPCDSVEMIYTWIATDSCGLSSEVSTRFYIYPDTLTGFVTQGVQELMVELSVECAESAMISVPIDLDRYDDKLVTITITDEDYIIQDEYVYTGPEDYLFGTGAFHVIYNISDDCGNAISDTINVQALDVSSPLFICTEDHFVVLSDFSTCTAIASWDIPIVQDNCDDVSLTQTSGPLPGDEIPVGTYDITYEATDESGNTSSCSFLLTVAPVDISVVDCRQIEIHYDESCQALLSQEAIIGSLAVECFIDYDLMVITATDTIAGDTIDISAFAGQSLIYMLCDPITGVCCSNEILLTDTAAPILTCGEMISISCLEDPNEYRPTVISECSQITWRTQDLAFADVCDGSSIRNTVTRQFIAVDQFGNESAPCVVTINVLEADLITLSNDDLIVWPSDSMLSCETFDPTALETMSRPTLDRGITSISIEEACGIRVFPTDRIISQDGCERIIERTWTIAEDECSDQPEQVTRVQTLRVIDDEAPSADITIRDYNVISVPEDCYGFFDSRNIPITLTDNCHPTEDLSWGVVIQGFQLPPQQNMLMPVRYNEVIIWMTDPCGNIGYDTIHVTVRDVEIPVAICLEHTTISVTDDIVHYPVSALDVGSYDNCGIASLQIRKDKRTCPSGDSGYKDYVTICCEDVGDTISVTLRVRDFEGNQNICSGKIYVQDRVSPVVHAPPNIVVSCHFDLYEQEGEDPYGHLFGIVTSEEKRGFIRIQEKELISSSGVMIDGYVEDNCDTPDSIRVETSTDLNDCDVGYIYRSFTAVDQYGNESAMRTQTIEIRSSTERLADLWIRYPTEDTTIYTCDRSATISPEHLGRPIIPSSSCVRTAITYEDTFLSADADPANTCVKVIRNWTIIDWCDDDPLANLLTYTQVIKLVDSEAPEIIGCSGQVATLTSVSEDCDFLSISLVKKAFDDCVMAEDLRWQAEIDHKADGTIDDIIDVEVDSLGQAVLDMLVPQGQHQVIWKVSDLCGNETTCIEAINVVNAKAPVPIAVGTSTSLGSSGHAEIWADDIIIKSEHPCADDIIHLLSFEEEEYDNARASLSLSCADIGIKRVKAYAVIFLEDGSVAYEATTVDIAVRDGSGSCDPSLASFTGLVSGLVFLEDGRVVPDVQLSLYESATDAYMGSDTTDLAGLFYLGEISDELSHYVTPQYSTDPLAGVTTLDMILIQRHLLGILPFDSPYKIVAADVNRDRRVTTSDLIHIRQALLYRPSDLTNQAHWRFVDDQLMFGDDRYPMETEMAENMEVTYDEPIIDLIAVKVADVNSSVELDIDPFSSNRSILSLKVEDTDFQEGDHFEVELRIPEDFDISGGQLSLSYDDNTLYVDDVKGYHGGELDYQILAPGVLLITMIGDKELKQRESLVSIRLEGRRSGRLSDNLALSSSPLAPEVYTSHLEVLDLQMFFETPEIQQNQDQWNLISIAPNPFRDQSIITLFSDQQTSYEVEIFDISGRLIYSFNTTLNKGPGQIVLYGQKFSGPGIYTYRISSVSSSTIGKLILTN